MFFKTQANSNAEVTTSRALRHLLVFQVRLAADAFRDLLLSPISIVVFVVDVVRKPVLEDSLYLKLMLLGRKSDRVIDLFDEYKDAGHFTVDRALEELAELVLNGHKRRKPSANTTTD